MILNKLVEIICPKCQASIEASMNRKGGSAFIFICPNCNKNVAVYGGKVGIVSDRMVRNLLIKKKMYQSKDIRINPRSMVIRERPISDSDISDLKILLETCKGPDDLISQL